MEKTKIYRLSPLAEFDIEEIFDYTINMHGQNQADKYTSELYSRFEWLSNSPELGLNRDELTEGYKSYFQGKHTIFYSETTEGIEIIRIIGQSEDVERHFEVDNLEPSYKDLLDQSGVSDEELKTPEQANDDLEL